MLALKLARKVRVSCGKLSGILVGKWGEVRGHQAQLLVALEELEEAEGDCLMKM